MKFATKPMQRYPPHLKHVAIPSAIKKFKFSADIQQMWKKMQTNCILSAPDEYLLGKLSELFSSALCMTLVQNDMHTHVSSS